MKKLIATLCALLLLTLPALAEDSPVMSRELTMIRTANEALADHYGLTLPALGLFDVTLDLCGETAIVTYVPNQLPESLVGRYYVIIAPHGVQPLWTHDGSLVPWQSGELASSVWGMPQMAEYLAASPSERHTDFPAYFPADLSSLTAFEAAGGSIHEVTSANSSAAYSAKVLAREAVTAMYGLTEAESAGLVTYGGDTLLVRYPDKHGEWEVMLHLHEGAEELGFYVTIHAETGLILNITVISGGVG